MILSCLQRRGDRALRRFFYLAALFAPAAPSRAQQNKPVKPAVKPPVKAQSVSVMSGADVMATVEGQTITRRELTYYWLQVDRNLPVKLGDLLAEQWKADKGSSPRYAVSDAAIYRRLYGAKADYAATLDSLITTRLVGILAKRKGIVVTQAQAAARARDLFNAFRKQTGTKLSDDEVMTKFQVPRDIFMQDMVYRVQSEALLALEFARRNGHPIGPDDWIEVRALFAKAEDLGDFDENEKQFIAAKTRVESWQAEVAAGQPFADVAKAHNEDNSAESGGLHGLALRGTGTPDNVLFTLAPGEMSSPKRVKNGWFVFTAARQGKAISEAERRVAWQAVAETTLPTLLDSLRRSAVITKN